MDHDSPAALGSSSSSSPSPASSSSSSPSLFRWTLGFLLVGLAWGLTTPFIRRAAIHHRPPPHARLEALAASPPSPPLRSSAAAVHAHGQAVVSPGRGGEWRARFAWLRWRAKLKLLAAWFGATDMLRNPRYAVPLLVNVTGSVWFFLLIGKAELSLTVPITNSLAFLFTVLGEWWVENKVISRDTFLGMTLSLVGIALCVQSKNNGA